MKKNDATVIAVLDIGTSKISCVVAKVYSWKKDFDILGAASSKSCGIKRGVVVNIDEVVATIKDVVGKAERLADLVVSAVYVGVSGGHIVGVNSNGVVGVRNNEEVSSVDVDRVIEAARAVPIAADQQVLHVLPQEFSIDKQDGVQNPLGMSGVRLEANVHVIKCGASMLQNIVKCVERCDLQVNDVVFQSLAGQYVLVDNEKELGVCLVDIGAGTTDIAVFVEKTIRHSVVIPIGGDQVTNDLALAFRTPTVCAEILKVGQDINLSDMESVEQVDIPSVNGQDLQQVAKNKVVEVVHARYEELFLMIAAELKRSGFYHKVAAGVVLTGGACQVGFCKELAERVFDLPVRCVAGCSGGSLDKLSDLEYSSAKGLLYYACDQISSGNFYTKPAKIKILTKVKQWLQYHF